MRKLSDLFVLLKLPISLQILVFSIEYSVYIVERKIRYTFAGKIS